ncbi:DDE-type integrase/transposase/recombinase [Paenibacillus alkaliterrae]|uniref:Mu transposase C-terminal domain-containing protein n=1 Tax=Paenibacillus alkaliterrae TaxID=320909 RepID=UPI001F3B908B|nr:DDE-type integrase/transposase/recombinase [Paenibacillus alkaliterrae]MCF2940127.1 DDE-type integrase/transposase/recombinase [Paenibacillus alkaliterrae]
MDEGMREKIALFRYGLIAPLLNGQVDRAAYLAEVSAKKHDVPCYGEKMYAAKTILEWLLFYRRKGFDGLKPGTRSDRGKSRTMSPDQQDHVLALRKQHAEMPVTVFYDYLVAKGEILPGRVSYSTIHRFLNLHGLLSGEATQGTERKRFAHDKVNMLWQTDMSEGPRLRIDGKLVRTHLIAFIDDCSRLVPFAQFVPTEKFDGLRIVMKEALIRRGIPKLLYTDNGKIFRSDILQLACAGLGIQLLHTRAYDPQSKGKIERMFLTCKTRFYTLLQAEPASSIEELNERFWKWLEEDYHRRPHASLEGKMPLEVYLSQIEQVRTVSDLAMLDTLFLRRAKRTVKHDATFSLENRLYEVPETFAGQKVEVRYDENDVHVYVEGKPAAQAKIVRFADNAHVKRERPALSFKALQESGGAADV